ncbi:hypothetical protein ULG90_15835 [Halopseudomonas pachastrellae]|nr:hypothetical protein ULG90_15835 [Halopseudomonas pachastrellae]
MLRFNASMNNMLIAQAKTLQATGNTDAATQTMNAAQQYAIGGVSDSDVIQRDTQLTSTNQQLIQNALSQAAAMSGENRPPDRGDPVLHRRYPGRHQAERRLQPVDQQRARRRRLAAVQPDGRRAADQQPGDATPSPATCRRCCRPGPALRSRSCPTPAPTSWMSAPCKPRSTPTEPVPRRSQRCASLTVMRMTVSGARQSIRWASQGHCCPLNNGEQQP